MNLNSSPTIGQLQALLSIADDHAGHHVLWADWDGRVRLDSLPPDVGPLGFEREQAGVMALRFQTLDRGNDYVGLQAAKDLDWVGLVFRALTDAWPLRQAGKVTYVESTP
nr:hypothetical protein [Variovorax boronicumulans]